MSPAPTPLLLKPRATSPTPLSLPRQPTRPAVEDCPTATATLTTTVDLPERVDVDHPLLWKTSSTPVIEHARRQRILSDAVDSVCRVLVADFALAGTTAWGERRRGLVTDMLTALLPVLENATLTLRDGVIADCERDRLVRPVRTRLQVTGLVDAAVQQADVLTLILVNAVLTASGPATPNVETVSEPASVQLPVQRPAA